MGGTRAAWVSLERMGAVMSKTVFAGALLSVAVMLGPPAALARDVACQPTTEKQVAALFDRWNAALGTKNPDKVVATYAPDATLLPTVKNGPLIGPGPIRGYFVHFLEQSPQGKINQRVIHIGCNIAYDIGLYTFTLHDPHTNQAADVQARYTFVYAPVHGAWRIVHHHSSAKPEAEK
jgi:uncharacterized protein (TIGR02246 family)